MRLKLSLLLFMIPLTAWSGTDQTRLTGAMGFGSSSSSDQYSATEGPLAFNLGIDYTLSSRVVIGVEHLRSLNMSPMATSIAFTGFNFRYYFPGSVPTRKLTIEDLAGDQMVVHGWFPYIALSAGFGQSSLPVDDDDRSANAGGLYLGFRLGIDHPILKNWGTRTELSFSQSMVSTGSLNTTGLFFGFYYFL